MIQARNLAVVVSLVAVVIAGLFATFPAASSAAGPVVTTRRNQEQLRLLGRGINGSSHPLARITLRRAIRDFSHRSSVSQQLAKNVPVLAGSDNFRPINLPLANLLVDGQLATPPALLRSGAQGSRLDTASKAFQQAWNKIRFCQGPIPYNDLDRLQHRLDVWRSVASTDLPPVPRFNSKLWLRNRRAMAYLQQLEQLVTALGDEANRKRICAYLEHGYTFDGGSAANLIEHLYRYRVTCIPGSEAHRFIAAVGRELEKLVRANQQRATRQLHLARRQLESAKQRSLQQKRLRWISRTSQAYSGRIGTRTRYRTIRRTYTRRTYTVPGRSYTIPGRTITVRR